MSSVRWTLLTVLVALFAQGKCESTAYPVIPRHLLDCYMDNGIYHRANRMPNSFESFLDLLRKVEESPASKNMNARELSMALLHHLKLDGIRFIPSDSRYYPSNLLPFAPSGEEYFKHRLTLVGLIPRIDRDYAKVLNETLTKKEMCNLHFMLSYSIDPYKREDERCSNLYEESRKLAWEPHRDVGGYLRRRGRHVRHGESLLPGKLSKELPTTYSEKGSKISTSDNVVESPNSLSTRDVARETHSKDFQKIRRRKRSVSEGRGKEKSEVEELVVPQHPKGPGSSAREEKDKFTIGDQELLSAGGPHYQRGGMQSLVQMAAFPRHDGGLYSRPMHSTDDSSYAGVVPGIPLSDCPVVNGVITTRYGSLTIGTVIAGIAAGLNPEDIPPVKLSVDPGELESLSDRVKNLWGVTLAGAVADTLSSSALLDPDNLQILKGGWNDSSDPKWYLLSGNQFKHLPEVGLRGSLDGLFLGANVKEWTSKFSGFKLSQILQTYYDCHWGSVGAKYRVQLRSKYAPDELFRKQVHLMSLVLKKQKTNVLTVLSYSHISKEAVDRVTQHIQTMDDNEKSYIGSFLSTRIDNSINMIAVVDSSWGHENLYAMFQVLRNAQVASTVGNNLTVICGKDGKVLFSSKNSADLYTLFTKDALLENCTRGLDFPLVFDTLDTFYRKIFHEEKMQQKMNTASQVSILFPYESLLQDNSYVTDKSRNFRNGFPDVRLMIASNGRSESFLPLVSDAKNLFSVLPRSVDPELKYTKELADGVKQSYQRISRPSCGSYFDDESVGTETRVIRDVAIGNIVYYRLLPQYFFTQHGQATVTITSKQRAPLTVCHSREMERPAGPSPRGGPDRSPEFSPDFPPEASPYGRQSEGPTEGQVQCKTITSDAYKIEMSNPCEGASNLRECHPLYISLSPPHQENVNIICPTCILPTNVQYEISVTGLTCYNAAATTLLSPVLMCLLFIYYWLKY